MAGTIATVPQFHKGQTVSFISGSGTIKGYQLESGHWSYVIEIEMGPKPEMGRIGAETTILLSHSELIVQDENNQFAKFPMSA